MFAARQVANGEFKKHNTGVCCRNIPRNPLTGCASVDYKSAEQRGYFKIDFLNVSVYKGIRDNDHLEQLINTEPLWDLLEQKEFVDLPFHVNGHHNVLSAMNPSESTPSSDSYDLTTNTQLGKVSERGLRLKSLGSRSLGCRKVAQQNFGIYMSASIALESVYR